MKIFLKLISVAIIAIFAVIASFNRVDVDITLWQGVTYHLSYAYIILIAIVAGITAGFTWAIGLYITAQNKLKEYQRKLEKTSVNAECDNSKVEVLEAKIEVLEKALKSALEKNND